MKFGKQLKLQAVKEWQEHYMSYKRLKRVIKKLMVQMKEQEELHMQTLKEKEKEKQTKNNSNNPNLKSRNTTSTNDMESDGKTNSKSSPSSSPLLGTASSSSSLLSPHPEDGSKLVTGDARKEFFAILENDIDKVNRFYATKFADLYEQYRELAIDTSGQSTRKTSHALTPPHSHILHRQTSNGTKSSSGTASSNHAEHEQSLSQAESQSPSFQAADALAPVDNSSNTSPTSAPLNSNKNYGSLVVDVADEAAVDGKLSNHQSQHSFFGSNEEQALLVKKHHITSAHSKQLEERSNKVLALYRHCLHLVLFSEINSEGLRKIVKKFDKNTGEDHTATFVPRLEKEAFVVDRYKSENLVQAVEQLFHKLSIARDQDVALAIAILKNTKKEVQNPSEEEDAHAHSSKWLLIAFAVILGLTLGLAPILPESEPRAHRCLGLLATITVLWVTEAVPFFVAGILIPLLVVVLGILADPVTGVPLPAEKAAKAAFGAMFSDTVMLILGGFSISTAFSKCGFELRLAAVIQRKFGHKPKLFLLAFMLLGAFLSCWISNVAAPVLLTSLLLPIVRDFGSTSTYARTLLLGLAFSCNIGGMMSPIASPQNAIASGYLNSVAPKYGISFTEWLSVSVPFCFVMVLIAWAYLVVVLLKDNDVKEIPTIIYEKSNLTKMHIGVILTSVLTVLLWCTLTYTRGILGEMGVVAVIPLVIFFGTGILTKNDLSQFSWHLILLVGGGGVLGAAVNSSRLLHIISEAIQPYLEGHSTYVTTLAVLLLAFVISTFVSHTVSALILTPLVVSIADQTNYIQLVVMLATLMMSGTMSLPMSSFPNVNSLLIDDDFNRNFIHPVDFLTHGTVVSIAGLLLLPTLGYGLCLMTFSPSPTLGLG